MMAQFSPVTRRILALGIAILALLAAVNLVLVPVYGLTADSLSALEDARFQRARLEAIAARPSLDKSAPVPASLYLVAPDRQRATDSLIAMIGTTAARYELQLDFIAPVESEGKRPQAIDLSLAARGEQDKILAFINDLERGEPAVHFVSWKLGADAPVPAASAAAPAPAEEGAQAAAAPNLTASSLLGFSGTAVAIWEQPQ